MSFSDAACDDHHVTIGDRAGVHEAVEAAGVEDDAFASLEVERFVAEGEGGFAGEKIDGLRAVVLMRGVRGLAGGDFRDVKMQGLAAERFVDGAAGEAFFGVEEKTHGAESVGAGRAWVLRKATMRAGASEGKVWPPS